MDLVTEMPHPVDYVHPNGRKATIDFIWGERGSSTQRVIIVWLNECGRYTRIGEEFGVWITFDDARKCGIDLAAKLLGAKTTCR
ncbi:hypothetical protein [Pseudomonas frederiksbergensis]|jgi:hypothetical protein|uniref:hypothetical protein n=1 Tax=Pseudomonas frederiksbergensis TaxID=104087 RepID=UPI00285BC5A9|nr:hypothetical protein [Pseudomonas frederiksbergensis]MDR7109242.1 hypothetical protein [Pseudomonas frederiksbergensis]